MKPGENESNKSLSYGVYFFILIIFVYAVLYVFNPNIFLSALNNFINIFKKLVLVLLLVMGLMFLVNFYATPRLIQKFLGKTAGIKGYLAAIISGILISGPPYVLYPMLGELKKQGMSHELLSVFLFNRNVKIPFLLASIYYFGLAYTLVLSVYIIIFSIINGKVMGFIMRQKDLSTF